MGYCIYCGNMTEDSDDVCVECIDSDSERSDDKKACPKYIRNKTLIKKEHSISKQSGVDYQHRSQADLQYLRYASPYMQCKKCKEFLGIWHCVRYALFKPRGKPYFIPCKVCGHMNKRIKGALGKELDEKWLPEKETSEK